MINFEEIKQETCQPPLLRRPNPAPYFHPIFLIFQITTSGVLTLLLTWSFHYHTSLCLTRHFSIHKDCPWLLTKLLCKRLSNIILTSRFNLLDKELTLLLILGRDKLSLGAFKCPYLKVMVALMVYVR